MDDLFATLDTYMSSHQLDLNMWYRTQSSKWYICIVDSRGQAIFQDMGRSLTALMKQASRDLQRFGYPRFTQKQLAQVRHIHQDRPVIAQPANERSLMDRRGSRKRWVERIQVELQMSGREFMKRWSAHGPQGFEADKRSLARELWLQAPQECKAEVSAPSV